jgi:hypothetical protein
VVAISISAPQSTAEALKKVADHYMLKNKAELKIKIVYFCCASRQKRLLNINIFDTY